MSDNVFIPKHIPIKACKKRSAVVVGITSYESLPHLSESENDAISVSKLLQAFGYEVSLLTSKNSGHLEPTYNNVKLEIEQLCKDKQYDDMILFYLNIL